MILSIITTEIFAIIISLILLYGNLFEGKQKNRKKNVFNILIPVMIIATLADMFSWVLDGMVKYRGLLFVCCFLSLFLSFVISGLFQAYCFEHIEEKRTISKKRIIPFYVLLGICLIWTIFASFSGDLFTLENGKYVEGRHYIVFIILNIALVLYQTIFILSMAKKNGKHDTIAFMIYLLLPTIAMILNAFVPDYSLAFPAMSIAALIVYIMLQSENEKTLIAKELYSSELASHDILTGLQNRFAYDKMTETRQNYSSTGVIFADVNALKYTNDHFGHKAGDQLLKDFAQMLLSYYRKDDVYRISGDEFVIILSGLTKAKFEERFEELKKSISEREVPIASVGCAYSLTGKVQDVVNLAEKEMYKEKEIFHTANPKFKRE